MADFLSSEEQTLVVEAIKEAELNTSGEVRVHIEPRCKGDAFERAVTVFGKLEMHKTALRNGILFYVATQDRKLAIVGDEGINEKVTDDFWDTEKDLMLSHFKQGHYAQGLAEAIKIAGQKLQEFFPYQAGDQNELSNEISFGGGADEA